jgi:hypothetical protein
MPIRLSRTSFRKEEDVVQEGVSRVVVLPAIPLEPHLVEQQPVQVADETGEALSAAQSIADGGGHLIELLQVLADLQIRIFETRDQQGGLPQIDGVVRERHQGGEGAVRWDRLGHS